MKLTRVMKESESLTKKLDFESSYNYKLQSNLKKDIINIVISDRE